MHQLRDEPASDVVDVPALVLGCHLGVEDHLQEQVTELVPGRVGVAAVDRVEQLVRFLQEMTRERLVGLLSVPRAPVRPAQACHHLHEVQESAALLGRGNRAVGDVGARVREIGGHDAGEVAPPSGTTASLGSVLRAGCTENVAAENRPKRGFTSTPSSSARSSSHPPNS